MGSTSSWTWSIGIKSRPASGEPMKVRQRALMVVEWEGDDPHPSDVVNVKITAIPEDLTIIVQLDGELEGVMQFGYFQDAVFESIGDLI